MLNALGNKVQMDFVDWLYGPWDENKYIQFQMLYSIPGVRQFMDYHLDKRADEEYLRRYGMTYDDIHDPRKLRQTGSASAYYGSAYRMISSNVTRLYR